MAATRPAVGAQARSLDGEDLKNRVRTVRGKGVDVKVLTSNPSRRQGLACFADDTGTQPDYIVEEMARHLLAEHWLENYVPKASAGGPERVLL